METNEIKRPFVTRCVRINEEDKWIITVGKTQVSNQIYDSQKDAEQALDDMDPFGPISSIWDLIGAMCFEIIRICNSNEIEKINTKNTEK